jgi:hypothetical protein
MVYWAKESFVPHGGLVTQGCPVAVLNKGSPEFDDNAALHELLKSLQVMSLIETYLFPSLQKQTCNNDNTRGNIMLVYGITSSQCVGTPLSDELIEAFFGVNTPRMLEGTFDPLVSGAMTVGWEIGKLLGVNFCQDEFLANNQEYEVHFAFIKSVLGQVMWAGMALCCLPLHDGAKVNPHMDHENCPHLTAVLNVTYVVYLFGRWWRVSLIYYMRKSITDMAHRVWASQELSVCCSRFLNQCEAYRMPQCNDDYDVLEDARRYFQDGVGSNGILVTLDQNTDLIVGLAMRSKASCDKQANYLAPVAHFISVLVRKHHLGLEEVVELLCLVGNLNSFYTKVNILGSMQSTPTDQRLWLTLPGGLIQYVIQKMVEYKGSVSAGPGFRCQPFLREMKLGKIKDNCKFLHYTVKNWCKEDRDPKNREGVNAVSSNKIWRGCTKRAVDSLSKKVCGMGVFSSHHVLHVASHIGLAPIEVLDHAVMTDVMRVSEAATRSTPPSNSGASSSTHPSSANQRKKGKKKGKQKAPTMATKSGKGKGKEKRGATKEAKFPKLYAYLRGGKDVSVSVMHDRYGRTLEAITRYLIIKHKLKKLTPSMVENILCESRRSTKVDDLFFPGQGISRRTPEGPWCWIVPILEGDHITFESRNMVSLGELGNEPMDPANLHPPPDRYVWNDARHVWNGANGLVDAVSLAETTLAISNKRKGVSTVTTEPTQRELKIPFLYISLHYPHLMPQLLKNIVEHPGKPNDFQDYMARLNQMPDLINMIRVFEGSNKPTKKPTNGVVMEQPPQPQLQLPVQKRRRKCVPPSPIKAFDFLPISDSLQESDILEESDFNLFLQHMDDGDGSGCDDHPFSYTLVNKPDFNAFGLIGGCIDSASGERFHKKGYSRPTTRAFKTGTTRAFKTNLSGAGVALVSPAPSPLPPFPPILVQWKGNFLWDNHKGIKYRVFPSPSYAASVLVTLTPAWVARLQSLNVTRPWSTLANDAHSAISCNKVPGQKVERISVQTPEGQKQGKMVVKRMDVPALGAQGQTRELFMGVLEYIPQMSVDGCLVRAKIGDSLGGVLVASDVEGAPKQWLFECKDDAMHHALLCTICLAGGDDSHKRLLKRAKRDNVCNVDGKSFVAGYLVEGSKTKMIGYYLIVACVPPEEGILPSNKIKQALFMALPCRKKPGAISCIIRLS